MRDGRLQQPIQVGYANIGTSSLRLVTRVDGHEVDQREIPPGADPFLVFLDPVSAGREAHVEVQVGADTLRRTVRLDPVRRLTLYVLPHSHHDLGYTDLQADTETKQMRNIDEGIALARKTADYPEGARFVWNLEVLWGADCYMRRRSAAERAMLVEAVKRGWVHLNGMYANELTGLCRPEELLRLFRYGTELGAQCGVPVTSAMASDVPGFTWGTVTAMAQAGIRYFSTAPNWFDRIGRLMQTWQDRPFWWVSRSGQERVLVWIPWTGYALSHVMKLDREWVATYQERLDSIGYPYDISYIRWSGHGDNAAPDPELPEFVRTWNAEFAWPRFVIGSVTDAFSALEKRSGRDLPELQGDLTPFWEDGAGSSARETRVNRNAADRLTQAETLAALLDPSRYDPAAFREAWRNVLLYSEHTWGAWCSVSDPENPFTRRQWETKQAFALQAEESSRALLSAVLTASADPARGGTGSREIEVHNTTSWTRSEVVTLSRELSAAGDRVSDAHGRAVPSQRLHSGELAFVAAAIPPFASARFHVRLGHPQNPPVPVTVRDGTVENGLIRVRIDPRTGDIVEMVRIGREREGVSDGPNLIPAGEPANTYLYLEGADVAHLQHAGAATLTVEDAGPLVATLRIDSSAPGCNSMVRRVRVHAGSDIAELSNLLDKRRAPANPDPGKGDPGSEWAQRGGKESVQFRFAFAVPEGVMRLDVPLAEMRPEVDQLQGTSKNWLPVGRWIDVSNREGGVTWVTLDAPLVEIGDVSADLLGSQRDPNAWREQIDATQRLYSWVMNNHWGTNYRAYQEGTVEFRYAVRPHAGYDPAAAHRVAVGLSQPLLWAAAPAQPAAVPPFRIEPEDVPALGLKPSDDGAAWILRLFGASGEDREARLRFPHGQPRRISRSDTTERAGNPIAGDHIPVRGWELVTLRIERSIG